MSEVFMSLAGKNIQPAIYVNLLLTIACKQVKDFVREYFVLCLLAAAFNVSLELLGSYGSKGSMYVYVNVHVCMYMCTCTALYRLNVMSLCTLLTAAFNVSLELQGGHCSDQLTLICRHSDNGILSDPNWIRNGTVESGQLLDTAFSGAMYTVQSNTEHRVTISGVGNVQALDGYIIQCVYSIQSNLFKSNPVKYSFIPPGQCM